MNQFDKDQRSVIIKNILVIVGLIVLSNFICQKVKCQSTEVKEMLNNITYSSRVLQDTSIDLWVGLPTSDTTEVIYVLLREDYLVEGDSINLIPFPYLETIYGYHVQYRKPYRVEFYDSKWNLINEEELLYIKRRKLFTHK